MISFQIKPWVAVGFPYLLIEFTLVCLWWGRTVARSIARRTVTWLPNFLGWVDYHISLAMGLWGRRVGPTTAVKQLGSEIRVRRKLLTYPSISKKMHGEPKCMIDVLAAVSCIRCHCCSSMLKLLPVNTLRSRDKTDNIITVSSRDKSPLPLLPKKAPQLYIYWIYC